MKKNIYIFTILIIFSFGLFFIYNTAQNKLKDENQEKLIKSIKEHYNSFVKTNKKSNIFEYNSEKKEYLIKGSIENNVELQLVDQKINNNQLYFQIENLNYYIFYNDVSPIENIITNDRYQSFIVFNENIITKNITNFYDDNDQLKFKIDSSFDLPIIIKDTNKYGVKYNNQLLYIHNDNVIDTYEKNNTDEQTRTNIRTFTYHTVYNPETQVCNSIQICHTINQFTEQMKYLSENNYLTLTMEELEMFLDNKIRIPLKTIVLTLDDGINLENSVNIIEKYKIYATFFIITSQHDASIYFDSKYARFESHTDNLHNNYKCSGGNQGSQMLCENHDIMVADLKISQQKLGDSYYFAYPFFDYNSKVIEALKEAGFKMAFVGQLGKEGFSDSTTDRFILRRKTIFGNLTLKEFIDYINASK